MTFLFLFNLATVLLRPTFNSCAIYDEGIKGCTVSWCAKGSSKWQTEAGFRGSILNLTEDTAYKLKIERAGMPTVDTCFRTWKSDVKIARTIELDQATFKAPFNVDFKGTEDGWIRITAKGGRLHNPDPVPTFVVKGAEYVIIEDMVLTGAADSKSVINISNSKAVRIRNCDISGWGTSEYKQCWKANFGKDRYKVGNGRYVSIKELEREGGPRKDVHYEGAIWLEKGADMTVIERCYIHDPLSRSVSWYYSHPAGPQAVVASSTGHSTVLRWNDFVGSDDHRWNDAVEGPGNFSETGGLNRDADVTGNFMIFANDDGIELDGGQQNIRCFGNRFEACLCGVSVQGCMVGPSFVYDNLFSGMVEEFDLVGQPIKTGGGKHGANSMTYLFDNLLWGRGTGITGRANLHSKVYGNKLYGSQKIQTPGGSAGTTEVSDNETGLKMEECDLPTTYPQRPLPFTLNRARITVGRERKSVTVNIIGKLPEGTKICKPESMTWLQPELKDSSIVVNFDDSKMHDRREYRGAFILRTPQGLSRPVSVYASSDFVPPLKAEQKEDIAIYAKKFSLSPAGTSYTTFNVPKDGMYFLMIHGSNASKKLQKICVTLDGEKLPVGDLRQYDYPTWAMVCPGCTSFGVRVYNFNLTAGRHKVEIEHVSGSSPFDALVLTDNPKSFEPR